MNKALEHKDHKILFLTLFPWFLIFDVLWNEFLRIFSFQLFICYISPFWELILVLWDKKRGSGSFLYWEINFDHCCRFEYLCLKELWSLKFKFGFLVKTPNVLNSRNPLLDLCFLKAENIKRKEERFFAPNLNTFYHEWIYNKRKREKWI